MNYEPMQDYIYLLYLIEIGVSEQIVSSVNEYFWVLFCSPPATPAGFESKLILA
jgi:hypothetical protein